MLIYGNPNAAVPSDDQEMFLIVAGRQEQHLNKLDAKKRWSSSTPTPATGRKLLNVSSDSQTYMDLLWEDATAFNDVSAHKKRRRPPPPKPAKKPSPPKPAPKPETKELVGVD